MIEMCPVRNLPIVAVRLERKALETPGINPATQILFLHQAGMAAEAALEEVPLETKPRLTEYAVSLFFKAGADEHIMRLGKTVASEPGCPFSESINRMLEAIQDPNYFDNFWNS